ncbi:MAG: hypothetical protein KKD73_07885 [Proteobacteria bacterium]|nr:hypothetical protein [Pseudomonadota bacterium]MBU1639546.1 hypothetical protein [Pseudomonadota bacterium]
MAKKIILSLVAGVIGGLVNSLGLWGSGVLGISTALGFTMTPHLSLPWLAPRLFQGGIWGLAFLLPFWTTSYYKKGMVIAIAQAIVMLVIIFPKMGFGFYGAQLGATAPLFVFVFTSFWGLSAAAFLKATR